MARRSRVPAPVPKQPARAALWWRAGLIIASALRARHNLAAALLDTNDLAGAEAEARKTIEINPLDASSYDLLGRALALQGQVGEAVAQLEQAARLAPNDTQVQDDLRKVRSTLH